MKRFLILALSIFSVSVFATEEPTPPPVDPEPIPEVFDAGVLSYSIVDNKIVLNSDLDAVIPHECAAYDQDGRIYIDIGGSQPRASIWSTAVFDAAVSYRPLRVKLNYAICDPKYGWQIKDLTINNNYDEGSRHGVRLQSRNQLRTKFVEGQIRENLYGYPIEVNVTGGINTQIDISKDKTMSKIEASVKSVNNGDGVRKTNVSMVIPSGYYYRFTGVETANGTILK